MTPRFSLSAPLLMASLLAWLLVGCTPAPTQTPTLAPTPTPRSPQRLRITNAGMTAIKGLVVHFAKDRIEFGDVAAGSTTEYKAVPNGVLRYSAYDYEVDGQVRSQPVTDFIGEQPLPGTDFTYRIDFDPGRIAQNEVIRLLDVTTDK